LRSTLRFQSAQASAGARACSCSAFAKTLYVHYITSKNAPSLAPRVCLVSSLEKLRLFTVFFFVRTKHHICECPGLNSCRTEQVHLSGPVFDEKHGHPCSAVDYYKNRAQSKQNRAQSKPELEPEPEPEPDQESPLRHHEKFFLFEIEYTRIKREKTMRDTAVGSGSNASLETEAKPGASA
jgi:hypothetical protein